MVYSSWWASMLSEVNQRGQASKFVSSFDWGCCPHWFWRRVLCDQLACSLGMSYQIHVRNLCARSQVSSSSLSWLCNLLPSSSIIPLLSLLARKIHAFSASLLHHQTHSSSSKICQLGCHAGGGSHEHFEGQTSTSLARIRCGTQELQGLGRFWKTK